ncbi:MAG: SAM-dependent methyltransferase [Ruminococcaceae bacterium]|nr:SAM-dependent methyltransferase [Oscillospiraceae bacterium]
MIINLSDRLSAAASLVKGGGIVADIGTDHGYLPIYLIQSGKIKKAIAADIGKMPLENARSSVAQYKLADKIELRLSDGLNSFKENEVNEIVFAGMGGTLIAKKLKEAPWIKNKNLHFVFQPQSRAEDLREFLYSNGFEIGTEIATHEGNRFYIAFDAFYTGEIREFSVADCFLGKLPKTDDAKTHIKKQVNRLQKRYDATKEIGKEDKELFETIHKLKDFLND